MALQQERPVIVKRPIPLVPRWHRVGWFGGAVLLLALLLVAIFGTRTGDIEHEWLPEYAVDTATDPAYAARAGGPVVEADRFLGLDANLDPDVVASHEWLIEYATDTATDPSVVATLGGPVVTFDRFVGLDANLDPDMPAWYMPEFAVDTASDPLVIATLGGPVVPVDRYLGGDANLDPDVP